MYLLHVSLASVGRDEDGVIVTRLEQTPDEPGVSNFASACERRFWIMFSFADLDASTMLVFKNRVKTLFSLL